MLPSCAIAAFSKKRMAAGSDVQTLVDATTVCCRDHESGRQRHECVQRGCSWLLAAAQSRLAHSCPPRRSIITRGRRTTGMLTHHRTTATVTDGLGMTARPVGRCRAETARPTKVRLVEDGAPTGVPLVIGRATTITVECHSGWSELYSTCCSANGRRICLFGFSALRADL